MHAAPYDQVSLSPWQIYNEHFCHGLLNNSYYSGVYALVKKSAITLDCWVDLVADRAINCKAIKIMNNLLVEELDQRKQKLMGARFEFVALDTHAPARVNVSDRNLSPMWRCQQLLIWLCLTNKGFLSYSYECYTRAMYHQFGCSITSDQEL